VTEWAFAQPPGFERLELVHQVDNVASCRVAEKCGYVLDRTLDAHPPEYPLVGHVHARTTPSGAVSEWVSGG
jgi:RimJ/RimL family protein N-acetyltransferase